jgi:hypothetical protein
MKIKSVNARQNSVERFVARWANSQDGYSDGAKGALKDLCYGGCASGMIGALIYTSDIKRFYVRHLDAISEIVEGLQDSLGKPIADKDSLGIPTLYTWVAVEEMGHKLLRELDPDF